MAFVVVATIVLVAANVAAETVLLIAVPGIPVKLVPVNVGLVEYENAPDPLFINTPVALAREPNLVTLVGILVIPNHGTPVKLVPVNVGIVEYESVPDPLFINTPVALAIEPNVVNIA